MKISVKQKTRTFLGQLGVVVLVSGLWFAYWWLALSTFGLGLLIADTIEVSIEKEAEETDD